MQNRLFLFFAAALFFLAAFLSRFVEHPANFTAVGAVALLSGYLFSKHRFSCILPLAILFASDLLIGFYHWQVMLAVYGGFIAYWAAGKFAQSFEEKWAILPTTLFASTFFFLTTNLAVWAFSGLYAKTAEGLMQAYLMAIPFYKWMLFGDLVYTFALLAIIETARFTLLSRRARFSILLANS